MVFLPLFSEEFILLDKQYYRFCIDVWHRSIAAFWADHAAGIFTAVLFPDTVTDLIKNSPEDDNGGIKTDQSGEYVGSKENKKSKYPWFCF